MLRKVLLVGLLAGLAAGLALAVLQHVTTVPLILEAEVFENGGAAHGHAAPAAAETAAATQAGHDHGSGASAWMPADGLERTLSTSGATLISAIGFALVLIAVLLLAGEEITVARALAYAAAGFASTGLSTALGQAPVLPGSITADLVDRQLWWGATALATAAGLYLLLKVPAWFARPVGLLLLVAPHAVGAPDAGGYGSALPAELAAHFASASIVVHAALWAMVGVAVGYIWRKVPA